MTTDRDDGTYSSSMKARLNKKYRGKKNSLFKSQEPLMKETPQIQKHEYQLEQPSYLEKQNHDRARS